MLAFGANVGNSVDWRVDPVRPFSSEKNRPRNDNRVAPLERCGGSIIQNTNDIVTPIHDDENDGSHDAGKKRG